MTTTVTMHDTMTVTKVQTETDIKSVTQTQIETSTKLVPTTRVWVSTEIIDNTKTVDHILTSGFESDGQSFGTGLPYFSDSQGPSFGSYFLPSPMTKSLKGFAHSYAVPSVWIDLPLATRRTLVRRRHAKSYAVHRSRQQEDADIPSSIACEGKASSY